METNNGNNEEFFITLRGTKVYKDWSTKTDVSKEKTPKTNS